jgi:hypothetical protein
VAAERGWQREFDDPIPLPSSGPAEDAGGRRALHPEATQGRTATRTLAARSPDADRLR